MDSFFRSERKRTKINCGEACLVEASKVGDFQLVVELVEEGVPNTEVAAIEAAKRGNKDIVLYLIDSGVTSFEDLYVASSFSGKKSLVETVAKVGHYIPSQRALDGILLGAAKSGSLLMVDYALSRGAVPSSLVSYLLNPDSEGFSDLVRRLTGSLDLNKTLVASAKYASLDGFKKVATLIGNVDLPTTNRAFIQAIYGGNKQVVELLKPSVVLSPCECRKATRAAAHSGMISILEKLKDYVDEDTVNVAALKGNAHIVDLFSELATGVTAGYAAYSGSIQVLDILDITSYGNIVLGAIRGGNMDIVWKCMDRVTISPRYVAELLRQGLHSRSSEAARYAVELARDSLRRSEYTNALNEALRSTQDTRFPLIPEYNLVANVDIIIGA